MGSVMDRLGVGAHGLVILIGMAALLCALIVEVVVPPPARVYEQMEVSECR